MAQAIFECPANDFATFQENLEIMKLLEANGYTVENGALAARALGYETAAAILEPIAKRCWR
jgi:hypothetical protein